MNLNKLFIILSIVSIPFFILRLYNELTYNKVAILISYKNLKNNFYLSNFKNFNEYLHICKKKGLYNIYNDENKLSDLLNEYNEFNLLKGLILKRFFPFLRFLKENAFYLIIPRNLNFRIKNLKYDNIFFYKNWILFEFNKTYSELLIQDADYIPASFEIMKNENINFFNLHNKNEGLIDSYLLFLTNSYFIETKYIDGSLFAKAHKIVKNTDDENEIISEYLRAILERNVRIIWIDKFNNNSNINIINLIDKLLSKLKKFNLKPDFVNNVFVDAQKFKYFKIFHILLFVLLTFFILKSIKRKLLNYIFVIVILSILYFLNLFHFVLFFFIILWLNNYYFNNSELKLHNYFNFTLMIIFSGILLNLFLTDAQSFVGLKNIAGIKFLFILPLIVALYFIDSKIPKFLKSSLTHKDFLIYLAGILIFLIIILRSDNYLLKQFYYEQKIRNFLEKIFIIRPRFKEIIFYPFLLISFSNLKNKKYKYLSYFCGLIAISTTLNSFLHIHTYLIVNIIRSLISIFSGTLIGIIFLYIFRKRLNERDFYKRLFRI